MLTKHFGASCIATNILEFTCSKKGQQKCDCELTTIFIETPIIEIFLIHIGKNIMVFFSIVFLGALAIFKDEKSNMYRFVNSVHCDIYTSRHIIFNMKVFLLKPQIEMKKKVVTCSSFYLNCAC